MTGENGIATGSIVNSFDIPEEAWEDLDSRPDCEEDHAQGSRLFATVVINGLRFHCEAIEVADHDGLQQASHDEWDGILSAYAHACGADGHFNTLTIRGREYAVFITPSCA